MLNDTDVLIGFGEPIYPGHPLVVACYTMLAFDSLADALETTEHGWSAMVGSTDVPGCGSSVRAAENLLDNLRRGGDIDLAVAAARVGWARALGGQAPIFDTAMGPGQTQADAMEPLFRTLSTRHLAPAVKV